MFFFEKKNQETIVFPTIGLSFGCFMEGSPMRLIAALAALLVTGTLTVGMPFALLWIINPALLLQCAARFHPYMKFVPVFIPLCVLPAVVLAMRRKRAVEPQPPWTPG